MEYHPPQQEPREPTGQPQDQQPVGRDDPAGWHQPAPHQQPPPAQQPRPQAPPPTPPVEIESDGALYVPAGLWWRIGAFLIDAVVLAIAHQIMLFIVGSTPPDLDQLILLMERMMAEIMAGGDFSNATMAQISELQQVAMFEGWLNVFTCAAYFTVFHGMLGATLGKLSLGLTVLRHDGRQLGYGLAFTRYMGYFIVAKLAYTAWMIPFNREQRTLYDMLLGTNVYRAKP